MEKNISRRKFVKTTLAGTAGVVLLRQTGMGHETKTFDPKGLPTRILGNTGLRVPLLGFGCGSRWMVEEDDDKALGLLEYALNSGLYYWDTAAMYGNDRISSEERIGKLLRHNREKVIMVTKTHERDAEEAKKSVERSLKRLQTDYLDIMHVHSINSVEDAESLGDKGKVLEVLYDYRDQGIIRHIGFTGHTTARGMKRAAELYDFEVMMIAMNHQVKSGEQNFEEHAVPYAAKKGIGVVAMKVIRPRETVKGIDPSMLVKYALSLDHVSMANIATDSRVILDKNLDTIRNFSPLTSGEMDEVQARLDPFFQHRGVEWMKPGYVDGHSEWNNLA